MTPTLSQAMFRVVPHFNVCPERSLRAAPRLPSR